MTCHGVTSRHYPSSPSSKINLPLACEVQSHIPVYDLIALESTGLTSYLINRLQDEWHHILHTGPGIYVLPTIYAPTKYSTTPNTTTTAFNTIIPREAAQSNKKGHHFAKSFSKHALQDPSSFIDYYSNPWLAAVAESWLGLAYRVTAQVNAVHSGGTAQETHRDYHLGFQEEVSCRRYPAATQVTSQFLTLRGAVAHTDMPVASGPTRFLHFSQTYKPEYWAFFQDKYVVFPLNFGNGLFFNPALFHAAGANQIDTRERGLRRVANLLQINSAFGKPMETVDSVPLVKATWDLLVARFRAVGGVLAGQELGPGMHSLQQREIRALVQAVA
ncbi:Phytanoyl-CoA dioxygenase family protein [Penicillium digitatum PHI26]|uniref:Phytanoyl-CoA dioxygenase family protein n=2 Tax=Penicillium digitatum TaxID=36651 RepID=K9GNR0_PEND2|nr:Phytanoyl-CoA dioxygenase family protein [Penicillium digitatum Pd1]EKV09429.1 Phytanoyl-CoA dioxygenase family protein [Penicillium digitatum Pd1]EKV14796.1 Phytanoyl-CoA dioxygenase family protein [Penicillium digitatum PHI26]KAG0156982.1 hypothetical protein PDIDSM_4165 [Penicillium digitatum]